MTLREIIAVSRRRKTFFIIPTILVTCLCVVGAFVLPNRYESSTAILVQKDEILNPLVSYEMAVAIANEDRLRTFNEIIYSRPIIQRVIDSLQLGRNVKTEEDAQTLIGMVKRDITIERRGSDSFRITYIDTDPVRAKMAVELLASLFMETVLKVEGQRNEHTVRFYEEKFGEIRQKFEASQNQLVSQLKERGDKLNPESRTLYTQIDNVEKQIGDLDALMSTYKQALVTLKAFPDSLHTEAGKQALFDLPRADLPFAADLRALLMKYDEYLRHYTARYPEVQKLEAQILDLLDRMRGAGESELAKWRTQRSDLDKRKTQLIDDITQSSIAQKMDEEKESNYSIYRRLYNDMKVKLEQAQTSRDLGSNAVHEFIIIDPPIVSSKPTKPNRAQIILGGFGLGLFLGILSMILKEVLDTTIRVPHDIVIYQKPVIAFITDGEDERSS